MDTDSIAEPDSQEVALPPMRLEMCLVGQTVSFVGVRGPGRRLTHRLAEMGLVPGEPMKIINHGPGPFIVTVKGSKLLLGRGMVSRVLVRPT